MTDLNPLAAHHLPFFITPPGATDVLFVIMAVVLIGAVLGHRGVLLLAAFPAGTDGPQ